MRHLPGEEADHQHIRDQQRAAHHDAERHSTYDPDVPSRYELDREDWTPMRGEDCGGCRACLGCAFWESVERERRAS